MQNKVKSLLDFMKEMGGTVTMKIIRESGFEKEIFVEALNKGLIYEPSHNVFRVVV